MFLGILGLCVRNDVLGWGVATRVHSLRIYGVLQWFTVSFLSCIIVLSFSPSFLDVLRAFVCVKWRGC